MLVTRILGDCPGCGGKNTYGNVSVSGDHVLRGCMSCKYKTTIWLPKIRKKIIYLDQFFFSHAFRGREQRFVDAARRIQHLSDLQLLVAPFSTIHEKETHLWRDNNRADLMEFVKSMSHGHEFQPAYKVEEVQIVKAFQAFLAGVFPEFVLNDCDAIASNVHKWDDYLRIDVGRYVGNIELIRHSKHQSIKDLIDIFKAWRQSTNTFDQDVAVEMRAAGNIYINSYLDYVSRVANGDYAALCDSPIRATVVESMLYCFSKETPQKECSKQVARFFASEHFAKIPYQALSASMFAKLKDMVKCGAFTNSKKTLKKLSGFSFDVNHIATYAPYCDAFVMDQPMAALVADPRVGIGRYGVRVFSLNNWNELISWLDALEAGMTEEHKASLSAAYH